MMTNEYLNKYKQANLYRGYPVISHRGILELTYLNRLITVMNKALTNSRVFAFRVDLKVPVDNNFTEECLIERFIASFKSKVRHSRRKAKQNNKKAHDTKVRYVWAREVSKRDYVHYHFVFLLNYDAYNCLGKFELGRDNMFNKIVEAWASALKMDSLISARSLIHIPKNSNYRLDLDDTESLNKFFYRTSYLAKLESKVIGGGKHNFGHSRT